MNPLPLILNFGLFCFCMTGPVSWPVTLVIGVGLGWNAGLYYASRRIDDAR